MVSMENIWLRNFKKKDWRMPNNFHSSPMHFTAKKTIFKIIAIDVI